jgi:release factor glutamine methyltransferase
MKKTIDGLLLEIPQDVYDPAEDSFLLAENLEIRNKMKILEIGSGSGYVSLYLAKKYPQGEFFCLDINPKAAIVTKKNAVKNRLQVTSLAADLFTSFYESKNNSRLFDIVLFNSPYLPVNDSGLLAKAWSGGKNGLDVISRFLVSLGCFLKKDGFCLLVVSSKANLAKLAGDCKRNQLTIELIDQVNEGGEEILLYRVTHQ